MANTEMVLSGKQKAAMLLMSLDASTAAELLKGVDSRTVQELAVELAYLNASGGHDSKQTLILARDFCNALRPAEGFHFENFLEEMLKNTLGSEKAGQIRNEIKNMLEKRDPFLRIRNTPAQALAPVLESEHPQAVGVVLSELDARKSSQILGMLSEGVRLSAVSRMASRETISPETKARIAEMVGKRLKAASEAEAGGVVQAKPEQSLRKVAVVLRNLGKELRDGLLGAIKEKDAEAGDKVSELMIVWEDIPQVADKPMQQAMRGIDAKKLALALNNADDAVKQKIRSNISERASAMVDEEASLMSAPKKEEVAAARDEIVKVLREMNLKGELTFMET